MIAHVLLIVGYLAVGFLTSAALAAYGTVVDAIDALCVIFIWPLVLFAVCLYGAGRLAMRFGDYLERRIIRRRK